MEALLRILKLPEDWLLVKLVNFSATTLIEVEDWLRENCQRPYKRVGWSEACSTKVGVAFENATEAVLFKLRWR